MSRPLKLKREGAVDAVVRAVVTGQVSQARRDGLTGRSRPPDRQQLLGAGTYPGARARRTVHPIYPSSASCASLAAAAIRRENQWSRASSSSMKAG